MKVRIIILLFIVVVAEFFIIRNRIKARDDVFIDGEFAIGEVQKYKQYDGGRTSLPQSVQFSYVVGERRFTNAYEQGVYDIPSKNISIGERYIVIYKKKNPQESFMLFDYPINDESDFEEYMDKFKINPPQSKKYFRWSD